MSVPPAAEAFAPLGESLLKPNLSTDKLAEAIGILRKLFAIEKTQLDFRYIEDEAERKRVLEAIRETQRRLTKNRSLSPQ